MGTGIRDGILMSDLRVVNTQSGQPEMHLHGAALARLQERIEREDQAMRHWRLAAVDLANDDGGPAGGA